MRTTLISGLILGAALFLGACATTTDSGAIGVERKQLMFGASSDEVNALALKEYDDLKKDASKKGTLDKNKEELARVNAIAKRLIPQTAVFRRDAPGWPWEVHVITSDELNAFCMPGGKIIFYSGLIEKLQLNDAQIAAVMGHEIAHALREHGRERMSQAKAAALLQTAGAVGLSIYDKDINPNYAAAGLGLGANLLYLLPNSRGQESEADDIGLELMARAGYDPNEATVLWQKMGSAGGGKPPAWLSTHPADDQRQARIRSLLPKVTPLYQAAKK